MSDKMKALVLTEYNHFEVQEIEKPIPSDDEVLLRVRACAICGSDVHGMDGSTGRRIPPVVMGHEASGEIVQAGCKVKNYKVGDRVTFDSTIYCNDCSYCKKGDVNLCDNRMVFGVSCGDYRKNGALAEYLAVKEYLLYRLPDNVSYEHAAMAEPLAVALHGVSLVEIKPADNAVVIGAGIIGLLTIAVLKERGVTRIISVDIDDARLEKAKEFGASAAVNSKISDAGAEIKRLTRSIGADLSFEAVGVQDTARLSLNCLRKGGNAVWIGNLSPDVNIPMQAAVTRQLGVYGSCACAGEYAESLALISKGKVNIGALLSAVVPLERGAEMFERLRSGKENLMKVVVTP